MKLLPRFPTALGVALAAACVVGVLVSCSNLSDDPLAPAESSGPAYTAVNPEMRAAIAVQEAHTPGLMANPEVVGTAVTLTDDGRPAVLILLLSDLGLATAPKELDGLPVITQVTGPITAYKGGGGGADHKARQARPIQLGVSGGNALDYANGYCCSGTLGALVQGGSQQYILSNSHVFAGDITGSQQAELNDPINQPGLIEVNCQNLANDYVANLSTLSSIEPGSNSNVDASLAKVIAGKVRIDGTILEVGTISSQTIAASVNQAVKKSGRTTGLTRSSVSGLNATINVGYSYECGGASYTKTFSGQILIANRANRFLAGGDSGSLMVQDVSTNPKAIGLLFAGGNNIAVANPINEVLSALNVTMVGQ